jgi:hypothetical protein
MYPNYDPYYGYAGPAGSSGYSLDPYYGYEWPRWGFGYKGESRSISDLEDICAAWDTNMRNLARMVSEVAGRPNPPDFTMFIDPYVALTERYSEARAIAQKKIDSASEFFTTKSADATPEYEHLLDVLNSHWGENTWADGDWSYDDVLSRITKMGATGKGNEPVPQPKTMDTLQYANAAVGVIEAPPKFMATALVEGAKGVATTTGKQVEILTKGLGGVASAGLGAMSWTTIALIGAAVGLGLIILPKVLAFTPAGRAAAFSGYRF